MPRTGKKQNSYVKAFVLLIALVIAFFFYYKVSNSNLLEGMFSVFDENVGEFSSQSEFTETDRDSLIKLVAGFWEYKSPASDTLTVLDRLEITDNGYIWKVEEVELTVPSGARKKITHVFHAYLYPSSKSPFDTTYTNSVIRNLTQLWIYDGDTCEISKYEGTVRHREVITNAFADYVVENFKDETEDLFLSKDVLIRNNRKYARYSEEDISTFFPGNLIELVYNLTSTEHNRKDEAYKVKNKEIRLSAEDITKPNIRLDPFVQCKSAKTVSAFIQLAVSEDLQSSKVEKRSAEQVMEFVTGYYMPYCLQTKLKTMVLGNKGVDGELRIAFAVNWQGGVEDVSLSIHAKSIDKKRWENELRQEIMKWKFQKLDKESKPVKVEFTKEIK